MFEYFLILCLFNDEAPGGVECQRVESPFYDQQVCMEKMVERLLTQGTAACIVRYMEETYHAPQKRQQQRDREREHQRTGPLRQAAGPGGGDRDERGRQVEA